MPSYDPAALSKMPGEVIKNIEHSNKDENSSDKGKDINVNELNIVAAKQNVNSNCGLVGAVQDPGQARIIVNRMKAFELKAKLKKVETSGVVEYWVYLKPEITRDLAIEKLKLLQQEKIDSFIIPDGEYKNGISLGVFDKHDNAKNHRQYLLDRGYSADVVENKRIAKEVWIAIVGHDDNVKYIEGLSPQFEKEGILLDHRKESCDYIDSLEDFQ